MNQSIISNIIIGAMTCLIIATAIFFIMKVIKDLGFGALLIIPILGVLWIIGYAINKMLK